MNEPLWISLKICRFLELIIFHDGFNKLHSIFGLKIITWKPQKVVQDSKVRNFWMGGAIAIKPSKLLYLHKNYLKYVDILQSRLTYFVAPWCSGYHYCTTSFSKSLNSDSVQVQTLLSTCRRFAMVRIPDNGPSWK